MIVRVFKSKVQLLIKLRNIRANDCSKVDVFTLVLLQRFEWRLVELRNMLT